MIEETERAGARGAVALVLCFVAGAVDAVGYLLLNHTMLAHMSGNTLDLAVDATRQEWSAALRHLWPVAMFVLGLVLSGLFHELGKRRGFSSLRVALLGEAALLLAVWVLAASVFTGGDRAAGLAYYVLAGLGALAMGLQNASLTHVGPLTVYTTHITGSLTKFGESLVEAISWLMTARRQQPRPRLGELLRQGMRKKQGVAVLLMGGLWLCFLWGGVAGALAWWRWDLGALGVPLILLFAVVLYDWRSPLQGGAR